MKVVSEIKLGKKEEETHTVIVYCIYTVRSKYVNTGLFLYVSIYFILQEVYMISYSLISRRYYYYHTILKGEHCFLCKIILKYKQYNIIIYTEHYYYYGTS